VVLRGPIVAQGRISNQRYHSSSSMAKKPQSDYRLSLRKRWMERSVGAEIGGKARIFQARQRALPLSATSLSPSLVEQFLEIECFPKRLGDAPQKSSTPSTINFCCASLIYSSDDQLLLAAASGRRQADRNGASSHIGPKSPTRPLPGTILPS
jgi:hypothetical protein